MEGKLHFPPKLFCQFHDVKNIYSLPKTVMPESHNGDENCKTELKATVPLGLESISLTLLLAFKQKVFLHRELRSSTAKKKV